MRKRTKILCLPRLLACIKNISCIALLFLEFSCQELFYSVTVDIQIPRIPENFLQQKKSHWTLYYIGYNDVLRDIQVERESSLELEISKMTNSPLLACMEYAGLPHLKKRDLRNEAEQCANPLGAIYPYDVKNGSIELQKGIQSEAAGLLLYLHSNNVQLHNFNTIKLLDTMKKKVPDKMIQRKKVLQDIAAGKLSYWSIKAKEELVVNIGDHGSWWNSISFYMEDITDDTIEISLPYPGKWYFISQETGDIAFFILSEQGKLLSNFEILTRRQY